MRKDLVGLKFNSLTVNSFSHQGKNWTLFWNCVCDCGNASVVASRDLVSNHTKSCGCIRKGKNHKNTHNMTNTKIYDCWHKMKSRCTNKNAKNFKDYGGRGITIFEDWKNSFESFYEWACVSGYNENLTIDRINNEEGYYPENCRWVDMKTQQNNRRSNVYLKRNGEIKSATQWAEELGIKADILRIVFNNRHLLELFDIPNKKEV